VCALPLHEGHNCALAAAALAHQRHGPPRWHVQAEVVEYRDVRAARVAEGDVAQVDGPCDGGQALRLGVLRVNGGPPVQQPKHGLQRGAALGHLRGQPAAPGEQPT
jgi:hypothetical protein